MPTRHTRRTPGNLQWEDNGVRGYSGGRDETNRINTVSLKVVSIPKLGGEAKACQITVSPPVLGSASKPVLVSRKDGGRSGMRANCAWSTREPSSTTGGDMYNTENQTTSRNRPKGTKESIATRESSRQTACCLLTTAPHGTLQRNPGFQTTQ